MECQRNKGLKAIGLILHGTQAEQMIDTVFVVLDVTVQHGRVRPQANLMSRARSVQPFLAVNLVIADDMPNMIAENLRPASGKRIDPSFFQLYKRLSNRELGSLGQVGNLDHRERLQVHLRKALLQSGNKIEKILKWKVGMKSADNMKLRYRLAVSGSSRLVGFLKSHGVG